MDKLYKLLFLLLLPLIVNAQEVWTNYTLSNSGLVSNNIQAIAIDVQGNKWIGTASGVSIFDGTNWTNYTPSNSGLAYNNLGNSDVSAIRIDAQGHKWFAIYGGGVSVFDGASWTTYNTGNSLLVNDYVNCIAIDAQGNKWFGTNSGISKYDGTNWTTYTSGNNSGLPGNTTSPASIRYIAIDAQNNKWFSCSVAGGSTGVCKFDGINWTTYNTSNSGLVDNYVYAIITDVQGNIWFGTNGGISKFDGVNWTNYSYSTGLSVMSIAIDTYGNKWFGISNGGIRKFDDTNWTVYNTTNSGLAFNSVSAIAIDALGNRWFGTQGSVSELSGYPLALKLLSFIGETEDNTDILTWQTTNEKNNKGFEVQRSSDGKAFEDIGFINAAKEEAAIHSYNYADTHPLNGANYYRLKMEDINGSFAYSNTVKLEDGKAVYSSLIISPNPTSSILYIATAAPGKELLIHDVTGRKMMRKVLPNDKNVMDISTLSPGVYFYEYGSEKGKFVKE